MLSFSLQRLVAHGQLTVVDATGRRHVFGRDESPAVAIRLHDRSLHWKLCFGPELYVGEAYMNGTLTIERGSVYDLVDVLSGGSEAGNPAWWFRLATAPGRQFRRIQQFNPVGRARRNVAHHYDLSRELYELFLDRDLQYSCAYFRGRDDSLEQAQYQKKRLIAAKLLLARGKRVLDIGCGWGGLALSLAREHDVDVTGITLSEEQLRCARERAQREGLFDRASFHLRDYRHQRGSFDRIVSVGMFEHVGVGHFREFFETVRRLLTEDGVMLLHTIGRADGPGVTNAWIRKYIFPGGYIPALSEIVPVVERAGLLITDVEVLRLHYAETLRHWRERFLANHDRVRTLYDERFCRMWEFYLAGSEAAFRNMGMVVFQLQIAKRQDAVPLIRDYMLTAEQPAVQGRAERDERAA